MPSSTPAGMLTDSDLRFSTRPSPRQVGQGSAIISPTPRQLRAGLLDDEEALARADLAAAAAHRGRLRAEVPALAPEPPHGSQGAVVSTWSSTWRPWKGVLEPDLEIVAQVRAAQHVAALAALLAAAHELAEDIVENVGEGAEILRAAAIAAMPLLRKAAWPKRS